MYKVTDALLNVSLDLISDVVFVLIKNREASVITEPAESRVAPRSQKSVLEGTSLSCAVSEKYALVIVEVSVFRKIP